MEKKAQPHIILYYVVRKNQGIQNEFKAKDQGGVWSLNQSFRAQGP